MRRGNPTVERDVQFRATAARALQKLVAWVKKTPLHTIRARGNDLAFAFDRDAVVVHMGEISPDLAGLEVVFGSERAGPSWGVRGGFMLPFTHSETGQRQVAIYLRHDPGKAFRLKGPLTMRPDLFVHEFIHYLDTKRTAEKILPKKAQKIGQTTGEGDLQYYASPVEFNAYYQQGMHNLEHFFMKGDGLNLKPQQHTWDFVSVNLTFFWGTEFIRYLRADPRWWHKFLRRARQDVEAFFARPLPKARKVRPVKPWSVPQLNRVYQSAYPPLGLVWLNYPEWFSFPLSQKPDDWPAWEPPAHFDWFDREIEKTVGRRLSHVIWVAKGKGWGVGRAHYDSGGD